MQSLKIIEDVENDHVNDRKKMLNDMGECSGCNGIFSKRLGLESDCLDSNSGSTINWLCDIGQISNPLLTLFLNV